MRERTRRYGPGSRSRLPWFAARVVSRGNRDGMRRPTSPAQSLMELQIENGLEAQRGDRPWGSLAKLSG
jgi:hypothetical protein